MNAEWYPRDMTHDRLYPHHSFMYLWIVGALLVLGGLGYSYLQSHPAGVIDGEHEGDVRTTVAAFGNALNSVPLLSPTVSEDIAQAYAPYVTPELLAAWQADPSDAPGRAASSPWPDHIEVDSVVLNETGAYDVAGRIVLVASTGDAGSVPIMLTVTNVGGSYLISSYAENPGAEPEKAPEGPVAVTVALDETKDAGSVTLTPFEVLEDSRCPTDVQCIQAGTVRVKVLVTSALGESELIFVPGVAMTTEAEVITLASVLPEKISTKEMKDADYRFAFEVSAR